VSGSLGGRARRASLYKERRFSDHAPLTMDYDL
jgi:exonuclease III